MLQSPAVLSLAVVLALASGCSKEEAGTPRALDDGGTAAEPDESTGESDASAAGADAITTALIGPEGGTLTSLDGRLTLTVPELAVLEETTFTIGTAETSDSGVLLGRAYDLGPDEVTFNAPVEVSISYATELKQGDDEDDLTVLVRNDDGLWDVALPSQVDTARERVSSPRWHFSDYAAGRRLEALTARQKRRLLSVGETLFVSPSGDDRNSGSSTSPLRSLMIACWRVTEGRTHVLDDDGEDGYDYSQVKQIEMEAGSYGEASAAIQEQQVREEWRPLEETTCSVNVTGKGPGTVILRPVKMMSGVLSRVKVQRTVLVLFGGASEVEVEGPVGVQDLSGGASCVRLIGGDFVNGRVHDCEVGICAPFYSLQEIRGTDISANGYGVNAEAGSTTLSGNTIVGNRIGLVVGPLQPNPNGEGGSGLSPVQMSDPGGNTISCNTELDVRAPEGIDAANTLWDHVPPWIIGGSPAGNDSQENLNSAGAMRPEIWCGCGNGTVEAGELCDDGNEVDDDACSNECVPAACDDGSVQAGEACDPSAMPTGCLPNFVCNGECLCECQRACADGQSLNPESCECECQGAACDDGQVLNPQTCECSSTSECGNGVLDSGEACDPVAAATACGANSGCGADCTCACLLEVLDCSAEQTLDVELCECVALCGNGVFDLGAESCDLSADVDCGEVSRVCSEACDCECQLMSEECVEPRYFDPIECACACSLSATDCDVDEVLDVENCACVPLCGNGVFDLGAESCDLSAAVDCGGAPWVCSEACACDCSLTAQDCSPAFPFDESECACMCSLGPEDCAPDSFDADTCQCVSNCGNGVVDAAEDCDPAEAVSSCDTSFSCGELCVCECDLVGGCTPFPNLVVTVNATFSNGMGACGAPTSFADVLNITVLDSVITLEQPSTGDINVGPIESDGSFSASHPGESYTGLLNPDGSGTALNTYGTGCMSTWDVSFAPQ